MYSSASATPFYYRHPGPLHAILLAGIVPLFLGGLLGDIVYYKTYQIQWINFASWLNAGGLLFCGLALLCALGQLFTASRKGGRPLAQVLLLAVTWVLGLFNAFEHAKDAWAAMPSSLILSAIVAILAVIVAWIGLSVPRVGSVK
ncbi:DUF2231 domain-containing protein [uncultured Oxalicibacterium sp.]|uniref:DUF2231 domain-containing protein n=1 Tax=uncultured Oxalicibacterium sp. TaxID=1168540 RepID=UPI0025D5544F|nr:DUF2231 domain-containing protein [uncultured Oxalicibacterium sp.]